MPGNATKGAFRAEGADRNRTSSGSQLLRAGVQRAASPLCWVQGAIQLNLLIVCVDIVWNPGWRRSTSALTDTDVKYLLLYFEKNYGLTSEKKLMAALSIVANEKCYHPIRDVLNGLVWDGRPGYAPACITFWGQSRATMWEKCSNTPCWEPSAMRSIRVPSMRSCSA